MDPLAQAFDRFRRGDAEALATVYDALAPTLLRTAMHLTNSPAAAEDLVQHTFLVAIEDRDTFDESRALAPWLAGILANRARAERQRATRPLDPERLPAPATAPPPDLQAFGTEFDAAVDDAIAALDPSVQPPLMLHLRHGMAAPEIAHVLRRPAATVRAQLARGLRQLRERLPPTLLPAARRHELAALLALPVGAGLDALRGQVLQAAQAALAAQAGAAAAAATASAAVTTPSFSQRSHC